MPRIATPREVAAAALLAVVAFVLANEIGRRHSLRADWTAEGRFTLSDRTRAILAGLREPVTLTAVLALPESPETAEETIVARIAEDVGELLRAFARASPAVRTATVDAYRDPARARELLRAFRVRLPNVVLVQRGEQRRAVGIARMAQLGRPARPGGTPPVLALRGEELLAEAVLAVSSPRRAVIYFTRGHGERDPADEGPAGLSLFDRRMRREGFDTRPFDSVAGGPVPADAALLVVAGPEAPLAAREARAIDAYLGRGGALLALLDPRFSGGRPLPTGLEATLAARGIRLGRDIVRDERAAFPFVPDDTFVVRDLADHPITAPLAGLALVVARARTVDGPEVLMRSSSGARRAAAPGEPAGGEPGALPLAAASSRVGRVVVIGDSDFAANAQLESAGNAELLARAVEWLHADRKLELPPRRIEATRLSLTSAQMRTALWLVLVVLPGSAATAGILLLSTRRRRA